MGLSNSKTSINSVAVPEVSSLAKIPVRSMGLSALDSNANSLRNDSTEWTTGVSTVSSVSAFPGLVLSGADEFYMRWASSAGGLSAVSGWIYVSNGTRSNTTAGPRFGACKSFTARAFPSHPSLAPVNCDPGFFIGICKNSGNATGLNTGLGLTTGAQSDTGWRQNSSGIGYVGFYYRKTQSLNWQIAVGDGAGNATLIDTGVAVDTSSTALLQFNYNGNTLKFYINGNFVGSVTTTLPSNNMPMSVWSGIAMMTATAATTQLIWGWSYAELLFQ